MVSRRQFIIWVRPKQLAFPCRILFRSILFSSIYLGTSLVTFADDLSSPFYFSATFRSSPNTSAPIFLVFKSHRQLSHNSTLYGSFDNLNIWSFHYIVLFISSPFDFHFCYGLTGRSCSRDNFYGQHTWTGKQLEAPVLLDTILHYSRWSRGKVFASRPEIRGFKPSWGL